MVKGQKADFGDVVEIVTPKTSYKGTLLESPENEILLLKLDNGYNIGFNKKDILGIKRIKKFEQKEKKEEIKKDSTKSNIGLIITGGTIASKLNYSKGGVTPLTSPEDFFKFYPEIFDKVNILRFECPFMKDSSQIDFKDWKKIAKICEKFLNDSDVKGVIILHGTDTLHYTSSALSFFLRNLNKPVVLTYSQRSSDRASSDANLNLKCAALAALSDVAEVMIVGHASTEDSFCYALRGTKVRKMYSSKRDAFKPINSEPVAKIFEDKLEILTDYNTRKEQKIKLDDKFEEKIALVKFYPGQDQDILDYYIKNKYKGIILEVFGLGQVSEKWISKLKDAVKKGLVICAANQTIYGRLNPNVYSVGR
jgi:glutamyl-tRNA(Gln) amidotransferase subunit D